MYDYIIVGAGFYGSTFARVATDLGKRCLVIEKRGHVAGAAYDTPFDNYYVSEYGAHIFHTNSKHIWDFVNKFTTMLPFVNKPKVKNGGKVYSFPINLMTLQQLYGINTPQEAVKYLEEVRAPFLNADKSNLEGWLKSIIGEDLYYKFYYHYTKKQWFKEPAELPASIARRVPIRLTFEENYFTTPYQGIPDCGYTKLIQNMLDGIDVELGVDYLNGRDKFNSMGKRIIYTGPIDKFYQYHFGKLGFRSMMFTKEIFKGDMQGNAVMNYTDEHPTYLRSIEHHHFYSQSFKIKHYTNGQENNEFRSCITYDQPLRMDDNAEPYYPLYDSMSQKCLESYQSLVTDKFVFGGRLGSYLYLDMDQSMAAAMQMVNRLENSKLTDCNKSVDISKCMI